MNEWKNHLLGHLTQVPWKPWCRIWAQQPAEIVNLIAGKKWHSKFAIARYIKGRKNVKKITFLELLYAAMLWLIKRSKKLDMSSGHCRGYVGHLAYMTLHAINHDGCQDTKCKWRHQCIFCKGTDHIVKNCTNKKYWLGTKDDCSGFVWDVTSNKCLAPSANEEPEHRLASCHRCTTERTNR